MAITNEDLELLKAYFITRQECDDKTDDINKKLSNDATELALIKSDVGTIKWLTKTILGAIIVVIVGAVFALILK